MIRIVNCQTKKTLLFDVHYSVFPVRDCLCREILNFSIPLKPYTIYHIPYTLFLETSPPYFYQTLCQRFPSGEHSRFGLENSQYFLREIFFMNY